MKNFIDDYIELGKINSVSDELFRSRLREAYLYAAASSDDPDTWTGAIIFDGDTELSRGVNRVVSGAKKTEDLLQKPKKYLAIDHAERQALYAAAKHGTKLEGSTMYMPWVPCCACGNGIVSSGISTLVMHYEKIIKTPSNWRDDVQLAVDILVEAGLTLEVYRGRIGNCEHKFRGETWYP